MSEVLTGNPSNVTTQLQATVVSMANNGSGAIRVATSTPHFFGTNDIVSMVTTVAFGTFVITVIDSTHFDLNGSTYTATGTGTASDMSLTPQILAPTDGDTQSAQLSGLLSAFQGLMDRTQYLQEQASTSGSLAGLTANAWQAMATTWHENQLADAALPTQGVGNSYPEWDAVNFQWMVGAYSGSTSSANIYCSYDAWDESWRPVITGGFGPFTTPTTLETAKDPADFTTFYLGITVSGGVQVDKCSAPSTVATVLTDSAAGYTDVQLAVFAGYVIIATGNTSSNAKVNFTVSNDKFATHTTVAVGATVGKVPGWVLRQNGTIFIAMPYQGNGGFALPFLYTSTDGHTFTERTLSFLTGTDVLTGLDWGADAFGPCWVMGVNSSGVGKLYRSADGLNWTRITISSPTTLAGLLSLAAMGRVWIATLSTSPELVYSLDTAGWFLMSAVVGNTARVRSNGAQTLASSTSGVRTSLVQGTVGGALP